MTLLYGKSPPGYDLALENRVPMGMTVTRFVWFLNTDIVGPHLHPLIPALPTLIGVRMGPSSVRSHPCAALGPRPFDAFQVG